MLKPLLEFWSPNIDYYAVILFCIWKKLLLTLGFAING